jgi:hypothetical protein
MLRVMWQASGGITPSTSSRTLSNGLAAIGWSRTLGTGRRAGRGVLVALESGFGSDGDRSERRCYVCDVDVVGWVRKTVMHGGWDGSETSTDFELSLCPDHELMESWPLDSVEDFYAMASDAMGVPSPFG